MALFEYPKAAAFGRVVPKNKIYEHAGANTGLKDLFVGQVDQITWAYKLAPETINLAATPAVSEIQVFTIGLRTGALDEAVLRASDRAIPFPLIFELTWSGKRKAIAAFKQPSEANAAKWTVSAYFGTKWVSEDAVRSPLPVALDLGALYERLLSSIIDAANVEPMTLQAPGMGEAPQSPFIQDADAPAMPLAERMARLEAIRLKMREIERIQVRLDRENQFNKRVAINAELRAARQQLAELQEYTLAGSDPAGLL
jgi:hypothetical protein